MDSAAQEITRLQKLDSKLKFVGSVNIGLSLVLIVCMVVLHFQAVTLGHKDPSDPDVAQGIQQLIRQLRFFKVYLWVCIGLLLVWGPAHIICLSKLKKLRKEADA